MEDIISLLESFEVAKKNLYSLIEGKNVVVPIFRDEQHSGLYFGSSGKFSWRIGMGGFDSVATVENLHRAYRDFFMRIFLLKMR